MDYWKSRFFREVGYVFANGLLEILLFFEFGSVFANGLLEIPFVLECWSVFANKLWGTWASSGLGEPFPGGILGNPPRRATLPSLGPWQSKAKP